MAEKPYWDGFKRGWVQERMGRLKLGSVNVGSSFKEHGSGETGS